MPRPTARPAPGMVGTMRAPGPAVPRMAAAISAKPPAGERLKGGAAGRRA